CHRVDQHVAAGAGADAFDGKRGQVQFESSQHRLGVHWYIAPSDGPDVETGATKIGDNDVIHSSDRADIARAHHAAHRAGDQGLVQTRITNVAQSPIREQSLQPARIAAGLYRPLDVFELPAYRPDRVGFDQGGVQARVLSYHRPEIATQVDR